MEDNRKTMAVLGVPDAKPSRTLDTIPFQQRVDALAQNVFQVHFHCSEFTCRCPVTHQPDWATIDIDYTPYRLLIESKSMKLYLETWREVGIFHEHLAQHILDDIVEQIEPFTCTVTVNFNTRGGIAIDATASYYEYGENKQL